MYFEVDFIFLISKQYKAKTGLPLASNASDHWMDQFDYGFDVGVRVW